MDRGDLSGTMPAVIQTVEQRQDLATVAATHTEAANFKAAVIGQTGGQCWVD